MANAKRDDNRVPTLLAVSDVDGATPVVVYADPTTHRLLVSAVGGTLDGLSDVVITSGAQGDIIYHNGTNWVNLAAGTSGKFLKTQGAGANPIWDTAGSSSVSTMVPIPAHMRLLVGDSPAITANTTAYHGLYYLPFGITVSKVTIACSSSFTTASTFDFVLYSEDGQTQILSGTTPSIAAANTAYSTSITPVAVTAGNYWFSVVANGGTVNLNLLASQATTDAHQALLTITGEPDYAGTTVVSAGVLPATLDPTALTFATNAGIIPRFD